MKYCESKEGPLFHLKRLYHFEGLHFDQVEHGPYYYLEISRGRVPRNAQSQFRPVSDDSANPPQIAGTILFLVFQIRPNPISGQPPPRSEVQFQEWVLRTLYPTFIFICSTKSRAVRLYEKPEREIPMISFNINQFNYQSISYNFRMVCYRCMLSTFHFQTVRHQ